MTRAQHETMNTHACALTLCTDCWQGRTSPLFQTRFLGHKGVTNNNHYFQCSRRQEFAQQDVHHCRQLVCVEVEGLNQPNPTKLLCLFPPSGFCRDFRDYCCGVKTLQAIRKGFLVLFGAIKTDSRSLVTRCYFYS